MLFFLGPEPTLFGKPKYCCMRLHYKNGEISGYFHTLRAVSRNPEDDGKGLCWDTMICCGTSSALLYCIILWMTLWVNLVKDITWPCVSWWSLKSFVFVLNNWSFPLHLLGCLHFRHTPVHCWNASYYKASYGAWRPGHWEETREVKKKQLLYVDFFSRLCNMVFFLPYLRRTQRLCSHLRGNQIFFKLLVHESYF